MRKIETGQLQFIAGSENRLIPERPTGPASNPEQEIRLVNLITFSQIERIIYHKIHEVRFTGSLDARSAVGAAIDHFLVLANFIYRYRDDYCFNPNIIYATWNLEDVFSRFYPTGWGRDKFIHALREFRPSFADDVNPRYALTKDSIKKNLIPLFNKVAGNFSLDALNLQNVAALEANRLQTSDKTASSETISEIAQRIVTERFDALVDDDQDYTYIARPDCVLVYKLNGEIFHIQVQPDYIKRLREKRKTTRARQIVARRIIGDFKDSDFRNLEDTQSPSGQTMLVYSWLLAEVGKRFKQNQRKWTRLSSGQKRPVFLIPQEITNPIEADKVQTALECLREESGEIFKPLPTLTEKSAQRAKNDLEQALTISRRVKI